MFHLTSGTPSGGTTIEIILSINLYFKIRSFTVVDVSDGDAFTYNAVVRMSSIRSYLEKNVF